MTAQTVSVSAGTRCKPFAVAPNSLVTITPGSGATATVEYTTGSAYDVDNNRATWLVWPYGSVGTVRNTVSRTDIFMRVTATSAAVAVAVDNAPNDPPVTVLPAFSPRPAPIAQYGNVAGMIGDSIVLNNWPSSTSTFVSVAEEGMHEWANAILGRRFNIVFNTGAGNTTAEQIFAQIPTALSFQPQFVFVSAGTNDLYNAPFRSGLVTFQRIQRIIQTLLDNGVIPIWTTVLPRGYINASILAEHLDCNDRLRQFAANNPCGIFWDGFRVLVDPTSTTCAPKSGVMYDSPPVHPNNYGAMICGKAIAAAANSYIPKQQIFSFWGEDQTTATYGSNLLVNPIFGTPGATAAANTTGNVPASWVGEWVVRAGTGSAALAIVDVTDADSGVVIGQALEATFSGTCTSGDEFRFTQSSGFAGSLVVGQPMLAEGWLQTATAANVDRLRVFLQANTTEQTNWGTITQESGRATLAQDISIAARTRAITVANNSSARVDYRIRFNGAGTNTVFRVWAPRVRKNLLPALL